MQPKQRKNAVMGGSWRTHLLKNTKTYRVAGLTCTLCVAFLVQGLSVGHARMDAWAWHSAPGGSGRFEPQIVALQRNRQELEGMGGGSL